MEFTKKDMLLSLIFPVITVLYGIIIFFSGEYDRMFQHITGVVTFAAGVVTGVLVMALKINTTECLKVQTIAFVVTFWLHSVTQTGFVPFGAANFIEQFYVLYYLAIDIGSIMLMMFRLPEDITARQRLTVFFSNPFLFSIINRLMMVFVNFLDDIGLLS